MIPRTRLAALLAVPALLSPALQARGDEGQYQGENPDRYAMVRALDGDARITKGDVEDTLAKGTPVGEGDVVESRGRGVLQLADGTRIAFGKNTRFTVASLFKDQDGTRQVLLRLDRGRLRVKDDGDDGARVRIDTASGSISASDRATFNVEVDPDGVSRVSVASGHVRVSNRRDDASLGSGEQISVFGPEDRLDRIRAFNTYDGDDFDRWSDDAWRVRRGESWSRVPAELRYYSDDLDSNGSWVYSDEYGWVWKPGGVAEDWRPYYQGRWAAYPGGMTWISYDPWAYVTYHHGRWAWSVGLGWAWIPGVYYSPAWVAWNYWDGYCGWAPLGYYNAPCTWGYGAWGGGYCWNVVNVTYINTGYVNRYCAYDRTVISGFNRGTGASAWTPDRGTAPPWRTRPLMATQAEFRNPSAGQFNRAFQPAVERDRFSAYQQRAATTGRQVFFRPDNGANRGNAGSGNGAPVARIPFENRSQNQGQEGRPATGGGAPPSRGGVGDRGFQPRPNGGNESARPGVTDRGFQPRPNTRDEGAPARGNGGTVDRGFQPRPNMGDEGGRPNNTPDRRPTPDRTPDRAPDRSFGRDFDRPAPRREAPPMREAPPAREAPQRFENRQPSQPERESRPEPSRPEPSRSEPSRGGGDRGGAPWHR